MKNAGKKEIVTPELRFPEFRDGQAWEAKTLKSVCEMQAGRFVQASEIREKSKPGLYPCYGGNGLRGYTETFTHSGKYPLIGRQGALCGNVKLADGQFHATEHALVATPRDRIDVDWLFHALERMNLNQYATGQAQPGLSVDVLERVAICLPHCEQEQQRIAECLSSLDELIGAAGQKIDALKIHRNWLTRQLFPSKDEPIPRFRFPEFQNAPEWEETSLGQIVDFESGGTPSKQNPRFWNGLIPWVSAKDMKLLFLDDTEDHITTAAADDGAKQVPAGTVLMLTRGMTLFKNVPICVVRRPMSFNQDVKALRAKGDLEQQFLPYLLLANKQRILGMVDAAGHGTGRLDTDELKSLNVMHPQGPEQMRIADCLTSLESLIPAHSDQLEALRIHKQGLMQQLFPS